MAQLFAPTPTPGIVHDHAFELIGHRPYWHRAAYRGGRWRHDHFRVCSFCRCIHPRDLIELLNNGRSTLATTDKPGKFLLTTPNPVAGKLVVIGSIPGPVFRRDNWPANRAEKIKWAATTPFEPSPVERLAGHFERPARELAPAAILWPLYSDHVNERQWPEIWDAAEYGAKHNA